MMKVNYVFATKILPPVFVFAIALMACLTTVS
jgi:hypothetical protein